MAEYADRDPIELDKRGGHYCRHVQAMTAEGLHEKSAIAAELAWRDERIDSLQGERDWARTVVARITNERTKLRQRVAELEARLDSMRNQLASLKCSEEHGTVADHILAKDDERISKERE